MSELKEGVQHSSERQGGTYLTVIEGTFRQQVNEDAQGAIKREWQTKSGDSGTKWELHMDSITGMITGMEIVDGNYGSSLNITMRSLGKDYIISLSASDRFFSDFAKKSPQIDFNRLIKLAPYAFDGDDGKSKRGMTVYQQDPNSGQLVKYDTGYFWDKDAKVVKNGVPAWSDYVTNSASQDQKDSFFLAERMFFKSFLEKNIFPKVKDAAAQGPVMQEGLGTSAPPKAPEPIEGEYDDGSLPF